MALVYWLLGRIGVAFRPRQLLTIGFAFTTHWWVAGMAGDAPWAQVVAVFFLLVALHLAIGRRWPFLAGLRWRLAAGSRLPVAFSLPAVRRPSTRTDGARRVVTPGCWPASPCRPC